jgi:hypothetical protein
VIEVDRVDTTLRQEAGQAEILGEGQVALVGNTRQRGIREANLRKDRFGSGNAAFTVAFVQQVDGRSKGFAEFGCGILGKLSGEITDLRKNIRQSKHLVEKPYESRQQLKFRLRKLLSSPEATDQRRLKFPDQ